MQFAINFIFPPSINLDFQPRHLLPTANNQNLMSFSLD